MSKVLVDRELLERIVNTNMADYAVIAYQHKEIRAILAQPAEAEGVEVVAWANEALSAFISADCKAYGDSRGGAAGSAAGVHQTPLVRQADHLAALSAVTAERDLAVQGGLQIIAERDALREDRDSQQRVCIAEMEKVNQLRAEVEMLREDAERFRHIERDCDSGMRGIYGDDWVEVIDGYIAEYAAMAAKEAEPEHVCSGCGAKGWTGNCLECIPY